jgi:ABC-2 type transport system permease protein
MRSDAFAVTRWTSSQTRAQFAAIAELRWRIARNQLRRKGGRGEMVGSIVMGLVFAIFTLGMMALAFSMTLLAFETGHRNRLVVILWAAFLLSQFLNIQVGQPGTLFDPTQLIRFPMRSGTYVTIRLFFGLMSPANIIVALLSLAIAAGITVAQPALWAYAFIALTIFAITNALFSRMIFAWVDRWLSTRRSREVLTALIFVAALSFQYLNVTFNPGLNSHAGRALPAKRLAAATALYHRVSPLLNPLPPHLIERAVLANNFAGFVLACIGCLAFATFFYLIFAWRTRIEFRGENLSEAAKATSAAKRSLPVGAAQRNAAGQLASATQPASAAQISGAQQTFSPAVRAMFGKELLQIRRNTGLFFGLIAPLFFVFLFAGRVAARGNSSWILPLALVYVMMGIAPLSYNAFGLEGVGTQFYFMAPIRMRDLFFAKNLVGFALAALDVGVTLIVIGRVSILPGPAVWISCLLWVAATVLLTTTLGNRRSITTPKKIETGRMASKQASQTSALLAFGILLGSAAVGAGLLLLSAYLGVQWFLVPVFAAFAVIAYFVYRWGQNTIDTFMFVHRDRMLEVLAKKT